ncbi:hypothetical protein [Microterricola viridarii]|uniref:hypothetical protein n=1 Tax=Microterricola viridarii TaxID=412690 RepID=UPI00136552C0|nr:hypothetical protein [Microterricola viridarii]
MYDFIESLVNAVRERTETFERGRARRRATRARAHIVHSHSASAAARGGRPVEVA